MRVRHLFALLAVLIAAGVLLLYVAPAGAGSATSPAAAGPAAAPSSHRAGAEPSPERPNCGQCEAAFCPETGVKCTFTGNCTGGKSGCCEYTCACDATCTDVSTPSNACSFTVPENCGNDPCHHVLCQQEFCKFQDFKCVSTGCLDGCCVYECDTAPCSGPFDCPPNACPGSCS